MVCSDFKKTKKKHPRATTNIKKLKHGQKTKKKRNNATIENKNKKQ